MNVIGTVKPDERHLVAPGIVAAFKGIWRDSWDQGRNISSTTRYLPFWNVVSQVDYPVTRAICHTKGKN
jgi:hypothetical protein